MKMHTYVVLGLISFLAGGTPGFAQRTEAPGPNPRRAERSGRMELTEEEREQRQIMRQEIREAREAGASEEELSALRAEWRTRLAAQRQEGMTDAQREERRRQQIQRRREWEENLTDEERERAIEFMARRRRAQEEESARRQRPEAGPDTLTPVEQEALREAMREALQFRRQWVLKHYDRDGDGMLSDEERAALRQDLREHMLRFFK